MLLSALLAAALAGAGVAATSVASGSDDTPDRPAISDDTPPDNPAPEEPQPTEPAPTEPPTTEPSPDLGALRDDCAAGDLSACDDLFTESESGSDDEAFGSSCGGRSLEPLDGACQSTFG